MRGMAEIIIAKHRNGAVGEILLRFKGEFCRFSNLEEDMCIPMPGEPIGTMFGSSSISKTKAPSSKEIKLKMKVHCLFKIIAELIFFSRFFLSLQQNGVEPDFEEKSGICYL